MTSSDDKESRFAAKPNAAKPDSTKPDMVSWVMIIATVVIVGAVAVWLYVRLVHVDPEPPKPIRIFRSPTSNDYSSNASSMVT